MNGQTERRTLSIGRLDINAPVILGMALVSLLLLGLNAILAGSLNRVFGTYFTSYLDLWMYVRCITGSLMHTDIGHYTGNFLMILAIGPLVEEKYGSGRLLLMIVLTAFVTGLVHVLLSHNTILMGASGIVFMLILLASFANIRQGHLPLTVILVAVLYLGNEVVGGIAAHDGVSHLSHILGGLCGALFGFVFRPREKVSSSF